MTFGFGKITTPHTGYLEEEGILDVMWALHWQVAGSSC